MIKFLKLLERIMIFFCVLAFIIGIFIFFCYFHKNEAGVVNIKNTYLISLDSKNMSPTLEKNDLLFIKKQDLENYHINNIVAYYVSDTNDKVSLKVGRIVDGYTNDDRDSYVFMIKEDNDDKNITVDGEKIIGKLTSNVIAGMGNIFYFIISRIGFICFSVVPFIMLFIIEVLLLLFEYLDEKKTAVIK